MVSTDELPELNSMNRALNIINCIIDLGIAFTLIYLLNRARTGFVRSDTIINRLIKLSMNTGLLTALCATATLIAVCVDLMLPSSALKYETDRLGFVR